MKKILLLVFCLSVQLSYAQVLTSPVMTIPLRGVRDMSPEKDLWTPTLKNQQLPKPHAGIEQAKVKAIKQELDAKYRSLRSQPGMAQRTTTGAPVLQDNFMGNVFNQSVPNDNDIAVSNGGYVASVSNTTLFGKNTSTGIVNSSVSLHTLCISLGLLAEEFDPKIVYDPDQDRFIIAFLNGFTDTTSNIILGFSQGNTTSGLWNFYALPGNPLNNHLWTDFPMMQVGEKELFLTVNLLYPDSSWQTGFNESIIWQIDKESGYQGQSLNTVLHSNIKYNGSAIRNLCPVKGGTGTYGPDAWFLSNRNFSPGNDTIFTVHVTDTIGSPSLQVIVDAVISPLRYHMPVDADQFNNPDKLIVNDARVLGAFLHNDKIQFVMSVLDTVTGYDGIYHGIMSQVSSSPQIAANVYTINDLDIAYPNIAYAGVNASDDHAIFGFLYTSSLYYPGSAAAAYDGSSYSTQTLLKAGAAAFKILVGNERWGDYTGCQRKYNEPGVVWTNGSYTLISGFCRTWIGKFAMNTSTGIQEGTSTEATTIYPNPTRDQTTVQFNLARTGRIKINVYDSKGALVKTLFHGSVVAGPNEISFQTMALTAGSYYLQITFDDTNVTVAKQEILVAH